MNKKPYLSKTLWVNLLLAVTALALPSAQAWMSKNPETVAMVFSGLNMVLRLVTKEKLSLGE